MDKLEKMNQDSGKEEFRNHVYFNANNRSRNKQRKGKMCTLFADLTVVFDLVDRKKGKR